MMVVGHGLVMASMLVLFLWIPTTSGDTTNCIDNFSDFVNLTFSYDNVYGTGNRFELYEAFYTPNRHLPFTVIVLYQAMLSNGTTENITTDECDGRTAWTWISSPAFIIMRAEYLNSLALLTLNHFRTYSSTPITITVPQPCQKQEYKFLSFITSQLQGVALGGGQCGGYIGNIDRFCMTEENALVGSLENRKLQPFTMMAGIGLLLQDLFVSLISANIWCQVLTGISQKASEYSFHGYGMFWGVTTTAVLSTVALCANDVQLIITIIHRNPGNPFVYLMTLGIPFILLSSLLMVVHIFRKTKPRLTAPWMYSGVFRLLSCGYCRKRKAEVIAGGVACWSILVALQWFLGHGAFILVAVLASPTTVPLNVMSLVLLLVCITYISALLHTIVAYTCTSPSKRQKGRGTEVVRAAILVPLLVVIMCYISLVAGSGFIINSDTNQNYYPSLITSAVGTVVIGIVTFGLKWFITAWFKWSPNNTGEHEDQDEQEGYHIMLDDVTPLISD